MPLPLRDPADVWRRGRPGSFGARPRWGAAAILQQGQSAITQAINGALVAARGVNTAGEVVVALPRGRMALPEQWRHHADIGRGPDGDRRRGAVAKPVRADAPAEGSRGAFRHQGIEPPV